MVPGLQIEAAELVASMLNNPAVIVGWQVLHKFKSSEDAAAVTEYNHGFVEKLKKNKKPTYVFAYWLLHETYDDGEDENVTLATVATDTLLGDLVFV